MGKNNRRKSRKKNNINQSSQNGNKLPQYRIVFSRVRQAQVPELVSKLSNFFEGKLGNSEEHEQRINAFTKNILDSDVARGVIFDTHKEYAEFLVEQFEAIMVPDNIEANISIEKIP